MSWDFPESHPRIIPFRDDIELLVADGHMHRHRAGAGQKALGNLKKQASVIFKARSRRSRQNTTNLTTSTPTFLVKL
jgi:hypothetical protein